MKVNFKVGLEVEGLLFFGIARTKVVGSFPVLKSPDMGCSHPERIKIPVYHFTEKIGAIFDRNGHLIWALWLALSLSLICHLLPLFSPLPFSSLGIDALTDGPRTSGLRSGEGGRSSENRERRVKRVDLREKSQKRENNNSGCQIQSVSPRGRRRDVWFPEWGDDEVVEEGECRGGQCAGFEFDNTWWGLLKAEWVGVGGHCCVLKERRFFLFLQELD